MTFNSLTSVPGAVAGQFAVTLNFSITKDGQPLLDMASLNQQRFYVTRYDATTRQYLQGNVRLRTFTAGTVAGDFVASQADIPFDPTLSGQVYGYIADEELFPGDIVPGKHINMYDNVASASIAFGAAQVTDTNAYQSLANVSGCATCHGTPYMKHGFRDPVVAGIPDFASCKSCHYDDRTGGHEDWQYMVDDPMGWATDVPPTGDYAYTANVMNDTHMSHAMEFPYPQSMANCATCHEGKLTETLANTNFTLQTCKSCHALQGIDARPELVDDLGVVIKEEGEYYQSHRAPSLEYLWEDGGVDGFHDPVTAPNCQLCHAPVADGGIARTFNEYHSGYDERISDPNGARHADTYTASIDDVVLTGNLLAVTFSVSDPAMVPYMYVSFYGWDSKHFVVASHSRDGSLGCSGGTRGCRMEMKPGDAADNALFTETGTGPWTVTLDMAAYVPTDTLDIPTLILDGVVKNAEITIAPRLYVDAGTADEVRLGLNAVTQTVDVAAGGLVAGYFKGANATVDAAKCNVCHDQLAVTFHSGSGRGGDVLACKNCHVTTSPGSHLEMQSRSIDSYVHAAHSFQQWDLDDVAAANDPVFTARKDLHINHTFPNFTIKNCEACHIAGTYNVPDQAQSMPGVLRASWDIADRAIGTVPEAVTGPASRACGGCHRADLINADLAGELASFDAHTEAGGTYVENDAEDVVLWGVIDKIMSMFQ
jgi:OmcA/MtrC family decaheme c-type cytochrome